MNNLSRLLGALVAGCASLSLVNVAAANCLGPVITANNVSSSCSVGTASGSAFRNGTSASVNLLTGNGAVARQRDANGKRVFCGSAQVAPFDQVTGNGTSATANQSNCATNGNFAVSVQVQVIG